MLRPAQTGSDQLSSAQHVHDARALRARLPELRGSGRRSGHWRALGVALCVLPKGDVAAPGCPKVRPRGVAGDRRVSWPTALAMNKASDDAAMRTGVATTAGAAMGRAESGIQCDRRCALLPAGWRHGSPAGEEGIVPSRPRLRVGTLRRRGASALHLALWLQHRLSTVPRTAGGALRTLVGERQTVELS